MRYSLLVATVKKLGEEAESADLLYLRSCSGNSFG